MIRRLVVVLGALVFVLAAAAPAMAQDDPAPTTEAPPTTIELSAPSTVAPPPPSTAAPAEVLGTTETNATDGANDQLALTGPNAAVISAAGLALLAAGLTTSATARRRR